MSRAGSRRDLRAEWPWRLRACLALPAAAAVLQSVTVRGDPVVGATVTADVVSDGPRPGARVRWQRCTGPQQAAAATGSRARRTARTYGVAPADTGEPAGGSRAHGRPPAGGDVVAAHGLGRAGAPADADADAGADPRPPVSVAPLSPHPLPARTTSRPAGTSRCSSRPPGPRPSPSRLPSQPADAVKATPPYLRPFPVVRVKGTLVAGGARISLLRVRAPSTATVDARCAGPGCRLQRVSFGGGRVHALERYLRAGTRITIRVTAGTAPSASSCAW